TEVFSRLLRRILKEDITGAILSLDELIMQGRDLTQFVNDFTWYMRNLMLVKNSEDMEDVLDVSSENLLQLKEEAAMIREDTLMRFIRIFSELSAKIRLSSNKRVQLEMAVIKLCKPEAERDEISLLERIRRLERGMSQILSGEASVKVQAAPADAQKSGEGLETAFPEEAEYKKAAPEDLKRIKSMWKSIVAETSGRFKVVLSAAEPKFNAQDPQDNRLFVVFADFLAEPYLNNTQTKELLEQIIRDKAGCQVEVKLVLAADEGIQKGSLASIDLEERLREFIHTDIEIEEEN
ncbi:MAG TPA: DNA polymerase III subunit gamma/tau, partial [Candidatus Choladousia intestinigallinarum]|nr:DNA polymerase III subunit gamma/tau [Candidatus Choladousia intestinigallinarum]